MKTIQKTLRAIVPTAAKQFAKNHVLTPYKLKRERLSADQVLLQNEPVSYTLEQEIDLSAVANFLMATGTGLYAKNGSKFEQILTGWFFGITPSSTGYYVYQNLDESGRILHIEFKGTKPHVEVFLDKTPRNIHQIAYFDSKLFVADTSNNQICVYDNQGNLQTTIVPRGQLSSGRSSSNYAHLNSIYPYEDKIYLVAHNYTQHSKRLSELIVLDRSSFNEVEAIKDIGSCAHNTIIHNGLRYVCDSLPGKIKRDDGEQIELGHFTRGLILSGEHLLCGGSIYGKRAERIGKDCFVYVLSHDLELKESIRFAGIGPCFDLTLLV
jgi:hypothetical protein